MNEAAARRPASFPYGRPGLGELRKRRGWPRTRIAEQAPDGGRFFGDAPVAYLTTPGVLSTQ